MSSLIYTTLMRRFISRLDRRFGEEQPPPTPHGFKTDVESREAIPSLFSEAESQDGFGTGFHLRKPRPGFSAQPLLHKVTHSARTVKYA